MNKQNAEIIGNAMQAAPTTQTPAQKGILESLEEAKTDKRLLDVMGVKTPAFIQTVRNLVVDPKNKMLARCNPKSILRAAMACAVSGLDLDPSLGQAAIVPFGDSATFMPMRNGLIRLARRSPHIAKIHTSAVYEGDIASYNPFTNELIYNQEPHERKILIGYMAYVEFKNGGSHMLYMTIDQIKAHMERYSKNYKNPTSLWKTNFPAMAEKTVLKQLLIKWAGVSTHDESELAQALKYDGSAANDLDLDGEMEYPDGTDNEIIETDYEDTGAYD